MKKIECTELKSICPVCGDKYVIHHPASNKITCVTCGFQFGINDDDKVDIMACYFASLGYSHERLISKSQKAELVLIKYIFMYNINIYTKWDKFKMAYYFNMDKAICYYAKRKIVEWLEDKEYGDIIRKHNKAIFELLNK